MNNSISKDFKFFSLLGFAFPTIIMMMFMSLYTIVDGIFISRIVGSLALSAVNIVFPAANVLMAAGIMLATGGSAVIARKIGEGKYREANENFTFLVLVGVVIGVLGLVLGILFLEPLCRLLGATDAILGYATSYLKGLLFFAPMCMLQMLFQSFFVTAGKPNLGLALTIAGGIANMILDYLLMGPGNMGVMGAALATGMGQTIPSIVGVIYFSLSARKKHKTQASLNDYESNNERLHFVKPSADWKMLVESCFNGSSEMVTNLSAAVITFLFNIIMLRLAGEMGVAAITVVLYGQFLFNALYLGFSIGVAPVISFNLGLKNHERLKRIYHICMRFVTGSSLIITAAALIGAPLIAQVFIPKGADAYDLTKRGCFLFAFSYLFAGTNILASGIFTALSDGKTSALISFLRTFVFIVAAVLILPIFLNTDGVWLSIPLAEALTLTVSVPLLIRYFSKTNTQDKAL